MAEAGDARFEAAETCITERLVERFAELLPAAAAASSSSSGAGGQPRAEEESNASASAVGANASAAAPAATDDDDDWQAYVTNLRRPRAAPQEARVEDRDDDHDMTIDFMCPEWSPAEACEASETFELLLTLGADVGVAREKVAEM